MPYIKKEDRKKFKIKTSNIESNTHIDLVKSVGRRIENAGDFNYFVSMLCKEYIEKHGKRYQYMNDLMGALEGIKLELYRKIISNYEDEKISENGGVY